MAKQITLNDFLTSEQLDAAYAMYLDYKQNAAKYPSTYAGAVAREIIEPNMEVIERKLGQKCDAGYLAYCCEFVFGQIE